MTDYDELAQEYRNVPLQAAVAASAKNLLSAANAALPLNEATRILDLGCGPGILSIELISQYGTNMRPDVYITALDKSPEMIEQLNATQSRQIQSSNAPSIWHSVTPTVGDAYDLSALEANSFSHVLAGLVLFLLPDPIRALHECHRILRPGGVIAHSSWPASDWQSMMQLTAKIRPDAPVYKLPTSAEEAESQAREAGFRDVKVMAMEVSLTYEDSEVFATWVLEKMPGLQPFIADYSEDEKRQLKNEMVQWMRYNTDVGSRRLTGTCLVCVGTK